MWDTLLEVWDTLVTREARTRPGSKTRELLAQLYRRTRCKSKHEKDKVFGFWLECQRLFQEAFHDSIDSIGEVDAFTGSEALDVNRGDILRDPKLSYIHPCLNQDRCWVTLHGCA